MAAPGPREADTAREAVGIYKTLLRDLLDTRPSGTRQRLADAIGKNRSFITQITNPAYSVPIPAQHLPVILDICHITAMRGRPSSPPITPPIRAGPMWSSGRMAHGRSRLRSRISAIRRGTANSRRR